MTLLTAMDTMTFSPGHAGSSSNAGRRRSAAGVAGVLLSLTTGAVSVTGPGTETGVLRPPFGLSARFAVSAVSFRREGISQDRAVPSFRNTDMARTSAAATGHGG